MQQERQLIGVLPACAAGVVRKKLGIMPESEKTGDERIYRITGKASSRSEARSGA